MRSPLVPLGLILALAAASCSDGDAASNTSPAPTSSVAPAATDSAPTDDPATDGQAVNASGTDTDTDDTDDDDLPVLDDVDTPEWVPETRTDELAVALADADRLRPQDAVDAFALLYPDIPGATPSDLPAGPGLGGTYTRWLIEHARDQLAPEQREFVDAHLAGDRVAVITSDGTVAIDSASGPAATGWRRPAGPTAPERVARYATLAGQVMQEWLVHWAGFPQFQVALELSRVPIPGRGMDAGPIPGSPGWCRVRVDPGFDAGATDARIKFYFAHEFFHCVQQRWNPGLDWRTAKWLVDGSADFAAADLYRRVYTPTTELHTHWFEVSSRPLSARWYDAWALFEVWAQTGHDAYGSIEAMVRAGGAVPGLLASGGMDGLIFRTEWSLRSARARIFESGEWQMAWPGPAPDHGPHDSFVFRGTRGLGKYDVKGVGKYGHAKPLVNMTDDVGVVTVVPHGGPMATYTAVGTLHVAEGAAARFCFHPSGCICPDGTTAGAVRMDAKGMVFGFAAGPQAASAKVEARKWDPKKMCKEPEPERSSSNGDPHLVTFDGLPFDVMTLGEFVAARDPETGFELQTRHEPLLFGAGTSAVAIGDGDHRITFTADRFEGEPVVRLDREVTDARSLELGEARVAAIDWPTEWRLEWPDGMVVELRWAMGWFITLTAPAARAERMTGLMGTGADDDYRNDLQLPDGTAIDPAFAEQPDSDFSLAWLVDDDTTLFDYTDGQSHETFRVPHDPNAEVEVSEEAVAECEAALGDEALSHEVRSCAFDVSATGDTSYVEAYQVVVSDRVAATAGAAEDEPAQPDPGDPVASREGGPTLTLSGTLVASYSDEAYADDVVWEFEGVFHAEAGTVVLLRADLCMGDATLFAEIRNVATDATGSAFLCGSQAIEAATAGDGDEYVDGENYVWIPSSGDYELTIGTDGSDPAFVTVDVFTDPTPTVVEPDAAADGDRSTLSGTGDTIVYPSGDVSVTFAASGLDVACVFEAYGAPTLGTDAIWSLGGYCPHAESVTSPGSDVPVIVVARTDAPTEVTLTPG